MKPLFVLMAVFLIVSCSHPSDDAHKEWSQGWIPLSLAESDDAFTEYQDFFKTIRLFQQLVAFRFPDRQLAEPHVLPAGSLELTWVVTGVSPKTGDVVRGKDGVPFLVFWDSVVRDTEASTLTSQGYVVNLLAYDRVWPWYQGETPLRLEWSRRPFGYTAETLVLNWLKPDERKNQTKVKEIVSDFLAVTYGPDSVELQTFLARRADERNLGVLVNQLAESLIEAQGEVDQQQVLQAWILDFQNRYSQRFQTNTYKDLLLSDLTPGWILHNLWLFNQRKNES